MSKRAFRAAYTRRIQGFTSLKEKPNFDCIFYNKSKGCTVYEARPKQCRTWPFWRAIVQSKDRWERESLHCPGMNQGAFHSAEFVELTILDDGTSGYIPK
jgi:Fe-S-cluster containining protein